MSQVSSNNFPSFTVHCSCQYYPFKHFSISSCSHRFQSRGQLHQPSSHIGVQYTRGPFNKQPHAVCALDGKTPAEITQSTVPVKLLVSSNYLDLIVFDPLTFCSLGFKLHRYLKTFVYIILYWIGRRDVLQGGASFVTPHVYDPSPLHVSLLRPLI